MGDVKVCRGLHITAQNLKNSDYSCTFYEIGKQFANFAHFDINARLNAGPL